jgi:hypothetical protein
MPGLNLLDFLNPINVAVEAVKKLFDVMLSLKDRKEQETASITADLIDLTQELSRTHSAIVKLVGPLRRVPDDPETFAANFKKAYDDFRDFVDAYDFLQERTRCHKIMQIYNRLKKRQPPFASKQHWSELLTNLQGLFKADMDIIEERYKPFIADFDKTMKSINQQAGHNDIPAAIATKKAFLDRLEPEYIENKALLEKMTDIVGKLTLML